MALCPAQRHYRDFGNSIYATQALHADRLALSKVPVNNVPTGDCDGPTGGTASDHVLKIVTRPLVAGGTESGWWAVCKSAGQLRWTRGTQESLEAMRAKGGERHIGATGRPDDPTTHHQKGVAWKRCVSGVTYATFPRNLSQC